MKTTEIKAIEKVENGIATIKTDIEEMHDYIEQGVFNVHKKPVVETEVKSLFTTKQGADTDATFLAFLPEGQALYTRGDYWIPGNRNF
jgi:hypothetical protein